MSGCGLGRARERADWFFKTSMSRDFGAVLEHGCRSACLPEIPCQEISFYVASGYCGTLHQRVMLDDGHLQLLVNIWARGLMVPSTFSSKPHETSDWLHQICSSRQMPMLAIGTLASMPNVVPLNYPLKFAEVTNGKRSFPSKRTDQWNNQSPTVKLAQNCPCADGVERLPESQWLARLVMEEALSIGSV
jgi:hypothetical protein